MKILAKGNSSVAGYRWYYLADKNNIYIALEDDSYPSNDDQAWKITYFLPSSELGCGPSVDDVLKFQIINTCKNIIDNKLKIVDWDKKKVLELYWENKKTTT